MLSSILNIGLMLSLVFAMSIASLIALLLVKLAKDRTIRVRIEPSEQRLFKVDKFFEATSVLSLENQRWVSSSRFAPVQSPLGVEIETQKRIRDDLMEISIKPLFAGRHRGIEIVVQVGDPLELFRKDVKVWCDDFVIDALPNSLLAPVPRLKATTSGMGEASSRFSGAGVELYALDEYRPYEETKNILWKKVSRMPDEKLIARIREANNPRTVRIGFLRVARRTGSQKEYLEFMDSVCESLGFVGNNLLAMGCLIEIVENCSHSENKEREGSFEDEKEVGIRTFRASNIDELSEILMSMWEEQSSLPTQRITLEVLDSDIVVTGFKDVQDMTLAKFVSRKLSVLIDDGGPAPAFASEKTTIYTDSKDLKGLILKVVEK